MRVKPAFPSTSRRICCQRSPAVLVGYYRDPKPASARLRRELRRPNRSWTVDETYVKVAGKWAYLYRAVDSAGDTIDFLLSPNRDLTAAKLFLRLALHMIRKGQIRWLAKGDVVGQRQFIHTLFGMTA